MSQTPHEQHYDQDLWYGNPEADKPNAAVAMSERPDLEFHRSWLPTCLDADETRDVIDYALFLEQKLESLTKRLEEIVYEHKVALPSKDDGLRGVYSIRAHMAQELLKELKS